MNTIRFTRALLGPCLLGLAMHGQIAVAADSDGNFAVEGAGSQTCATFVEVREKRDSDYYVFAGWVDGYLTGANQNLDNTYDVTPWQSLELILAALDRLCGEDGEKRFISAVNDIIRGLVPSRLQTQSEVVQATHDGMGAFMYKAVLVEVQKLLAKNGHYRGEADGVYGPMTRDAIIAYQESADIKPSGLPDQITLYRLFLEASQTPVPAVEPESEAQQ